MAPPALPYVYATEQDIQALTSVDGEVARLDDDGDNTIDTPVETGYLSSAISWATDRINFFCLHRYSAVDLAQSWLVNNWCVIFAAYWLSTRRGNPPPGSFDDLYKEALEDLKLVRQAVVNLPAIALRTSAWPAWSNVRVDQLYALRKIRVERPISETRGTAPDYRQNQDWASNFIIEP